MLSLVQLRLLHSELLGTADENDCVKSLRYIHHKNIKFLNKC